MHELAEPLRVTAHRDVSTGQIELVEAAPKPGCRAVHADRPVRCRSPACGRACDFVCRLDSRAVSWDTSLRSRSGPSVAIRQYRGESATWAAAHRPGTAPDPSAPTPPDQHHRSVAVTTPPTPHARTPQRLRHRMTIAARPTAAIRSASAPCRASRPDPHRTSSVTPPVRALASPGPSSRTAPPEGNDPCPPLSSSF